MRLRVTERPCARNVAVAALSHLLFTVMGVTASSCLALDGVNAMQMTTANGWTAFELLSQGDAIGAIADSGYGSVATLGKYDGLGPYRHGATLSLFMNHESDASAISRVDVSRDALRQAVANRVSGGATPFPATIVSSVGWAYDAIYEGNYHAVLTPAPVASGPGVAAYASAHFYRLCSGTMHSPAAFGPGRGFVDRLYITGEESYGPNGQLFALDPATNDLWEIPDVGRASWENAAAIDTHEAQHVAIILTSDYYADPGDYLRLYVGTKGMDANADGTVDFLERNGLRGGQVYYFTADGGETGLNDGSIVGHWSTTITAALRDSKIEDIHTNPHNGNQAAFNDSDDGVYQIDALMAFSGGLFSEGGSRAVISQLRGRDAATIFWPDNLLWSANGKLFVQEDDEAGFETWQLDGDGSNPVVVSSAFSEPSGIDDISTLLGYQAGSVLVTSIMGDGVTGGQLAVLVSPQAATLPASADFDGDGRVDGDDLLVWQCGAGLIGSGDLSRGDANHDGRVDGVDLALWRSQFGMTLPLSQAVPEPVGAGLAGVAIVITIRPPTRDRGIKHPREPQMG
jgi:hypothetical protein